MTRLRWTRPAPRLLLDSAILVLLLGAFAYWWQGNLAHEIVGTIFFVLLIRHLVNNGRWWSAARRGPYDLRRAMSLILTLLLAASMAVLLLTSLAISQSLFAFLPQPGLFTMREMHWFSAYWIMAIVGLHLGLNWGRVASLFRSIGWMTGRTRVWAVLGGGAPWPLPCRAISARRFSGFGPGCRFSTAWQCGISMKPFCPSSATGWQSSVCSPCLATFLCAWPRSPSRGDESDHGQSLDFHAWINASDA